MDAFSITGNAPLNNIKIPKSGKQVIAFSLWGNNPFYTRGAIRNAELAHELYPEWVCRFYCGAQTEKSVIQQLENLNCEVVVMDELEGFGGTMWRFLVANDPSVKCFICRDADSRLNEREKLAVDEWLASGKAFHIMRDAIVHCDLILAGMWGGYSGVLPNLQELMKSKIDHSRKFLDQDFLSLHIWPMIKKHCLIHDAYYDCFGSTTFAEGSQLTPPLHIGAGVPIEWDKPKSL